MADVTPVGECVHKQDGGDEVIRCTFLVSGGALAGEGGLLLGRGGAIAGEGEGLSLGRGRGYRWGGGGAIAGEGEGLLLGRGRGYCWGGGGAIAGEREGLLLGRGGAIAGEGNRWGGAIATEARMLQEMFHCRMVLDDMNGMEGMRLRCCADFHCRSAVHPGVHLGVEGVHVLSSGASQECTGRLRL